ncbi:MAG TPA: 2-oxoacid:ferredoxin oxidoreductase subunit beta [Elusimicrobiota bacterium]|jgi:2-oxoglutarate ferredoxin oxidoreductase subunit beta|nr:2-oxoacid:ferredoxin oxidoreductase subunit beta [Elusimicrobiota bacterium]HNA59471.1 2-oxoacid:ferredoxin oxidoreductase subunit beta [Elusimicrobiota bacterium]HNC74537.1 2-oxoacid:ferredoxin oxidoreductase subunit beta [Elusimicrobiota bacterium]HNF58014.1 2-oxoacid:ferredoxin oxidoreductase subunit beta [Elusimicrobiota bacterium]HNG45201.1 2-oxoacid:ferredoxin oxidoreductase subunit beta [Elusimicrobiota bacterium]
MTEVPVPSGAEKRPTFTKNDFVSGAEVRWCPGCGDYSILGSMQQTLAKFDIPRENYVFVSGIGCSSRFPYYMNTYGFHTIHGRAPTIATGLRCVNPDLSIWVITGDGDGLSIGGNHLLHAMRRNLNFNILLVNNQIYGLTKGQYSPTSPTGKMTKSSPYGSIDHPINPLCIAIASEATFIARTLDSDPRHMSATLERAMKHKGIAFVEVYQNCIIFNDKAHGPVTGRETRDDRMVYLEHGKPLLFGKNKSKAIRLNGLYPEMADYDPTNTRGLLIHDETDPRPNHAYLLTQLTYPDFPVPFGVFRAVEKPTYDDLMNQQIRDIVAKKGKGSLEKLIYSGDTWRVQ